MWRKWGANFLSSQHFALDILGETADSKEENWWKFEAAVGTVDLAAKLNKLSALTPAALSPSSDSSASDGIHIAGVYDVWQSCHRYQALCAADPQTVASSAGRTGGTEGSNGGLEGLEETGRWEGEEGIATGVTARPGGGQLGWQWWRGEQLQHTLITSLQPLLFFDFLYCWKPRSALQICAVKADNTLCRHTVL